MWENAYNAARTALLSRNERLRTVMLGLWYPAVVGTLLVLFLDRWFPAFSKAYNQQIAWYGLFLIIYYTVLFEESQFTTDYGFLAFFVDFVDIFLIYMAYVLLGYGGQGQPNARGFYIVMAITFGEPILWRQVFKPQRRDLNVLCLIGIAVVLIQAFQGSFDWWAVAVLWILLLIYIGIVISRIR
jgi:hypothetical protein